MSEKIKELLASYVLGDLTSEEVAEVQKLLATRPELKQEVESLEQTLALFPLGLPEIELPSNLGDHILQAAVAGKLEKKSQKKLILLTVIGSITAAILVTLSISNYRLQQQVATNQEIIAVLAQKSKDLLALKGTELTPDASGSLVVIPESQTMVMTLNNLTPLPQGKIYRLWGVKDGKKIYCGEFNTDQQGRILVKLPLDADMLDSSGVIITVESVKQFSVPKGETVMTGSI